MSVESGAAPAIDVRGLTIEYGDITAVDDLSFTMPAGSVYAVLGPNGAGKTSLIKALATLVDPTRGRVLIAGVSLVEDPDEVRSRISLSGQFSAVDDDLTAAENIILVGKLYGIDKPESRAVELSVTLGLADIFGRRVGELSGGNQRRVDLALSLVNRPQVLFLDEPTTGLDPRARIALWEVVESLNAEGTSVLLTTQYLEEADRLADEIIVLDRGKQVERGTPSELKRRIGGHIIDMEPIDLNELELLNQIIDQQPAVRHHGSTSTTTSANTDEPNAVATLVGAVQAAGIGLLNIEVTTPSLDDVFFAVTERN